MKSCQGTPLGLQVNDFGCADDADGVYANVDDCRDSPAKWTIDEQGCAVVQTPVPWAASSLTGPMQIVRTFLCRHLMGRFIFSKNGLGTTSTISSSNIPIRMETQILQLGAESWNIHSLIAKNVHLFYGSFGATYHNDVIEKKKCGENALNPAKLVEWTILH